MKENFEMRDKYKASVINKRMYSDLELGRSNVIVSIDWRVTLSSLTRYMCARSVIYYSRSKLCHMMTI